MPIIDSADHELPTRLALERTLLAHDRTLMAWTRTSTSMISFAFTIYKFFEEMRPAGAGRPGLLTPRGVGLSLAAVGTGCLLLAIWQHRQSLASLRAMGAPSQLSVATVIAASIALLGVVTLVAIGARA